MDQSSYPILDAERSIQQHTMWSEMFGRTNLWIRSSAVTSRLLQQLPWFFPLSNKNQIFGIFPIGAVPNEIITHLWHGNEYLHENDHILDNTWQDKRIDECFELLQSEATRERKKWCVQCIRFGWKISRNMNYVSQTKTYSSNIHTWISTIQAANHNCRIFYHDNSDTNPSNEKDF